MSNVKYSPDVEKCAVLPLISQAHKSTFLLENFSFQRQTSYANMRTGAPQTIRLIAFFPPPLNGQSLMSSKTAAFIEKHLPSDRININSKSNFKKLALQMLAAMRILFSSRRGTIYTTPPGQLGLWSFLIIIAAARIRKTEIFVHHHSFRPINCGPLQSVRALNKIGGKYLTHIFLSERMMESYFCTYPTNEKNGIVLPNAFAFPPSLSLPQTPTGPITIGHLSVLTHAKGVTYAIQLFDRLRQTHPNLRMILAGPISEPSIKPWIDGAIAQHKDNFAYLGPIDGDTKSRFFSDIDIFLLPSTLVDEADPLVLQESYEAGVTVMAPKTGCIAERLIDHTALLSLDLNTDVSNILTFIGEIQSNRHQIRMQNWLHAKKSFESASHFTQNFLNALARPNSADPSS